MSDRVVFDRDEMRMYATRSIRKTGNSYVISIPPQVLEGAGLGEDDEVVISAEIEDEEIRIKRADKVDFALPDDGE